MAPDPATPADLLARALRDDPARALLTFYDDATGERAELSVLTFANWVAKTGNFLVDGLGLEVGDRVAVLLPCHWQAVVWWQACWAAGIVVVTEPAAAGPAGSLAALVRPARWSDGLSPSGPPDAGEVVALGLGPMALPVAGLELPAGAVDHDREIHGHGDRFTPPPGLSAGRPALADAGGLHTAGGLLAATEDAVARWTLTAADRVLLASPLRSVTDAVAALLAPLQSGAGAVLVRHADRAESATLAHRVGEERVTAVAPGPTGALASRFSLSGIRRLD